MVIPDCLLLIDIQLSQPLLTHHMVLAPEQGGDAAQNTNYQFIIQGSPRMETVPQKGLTDAARGE